jgi:hypothetical protein
MTLLLVVAGICAVLFLALLSIRRAIREERDRQEMLEGLRRQGLLEE